MQIIRHVNLVHYVTSMKNAIKYSVQDLKHSVYNFIPIYGNYQAKKKNKTEHKT